MSSEMEFFIVSSYKDKIDLPVWQNNIASELTVTCLILNN